MKSTSVAMPDREPWSITLGLQASDCDNERVILCPEGAVLEKAFEVARSLLGSAERTVRIIGRGVTKVPRPPWLLGLTDGTVTLTELDAYVPCAKAPLMQELAADTEKWISEVFADVLGELAPAKALWSSVVNRVFLPEYRAWPLVVGLVERHPTAEFHLVGAPWVGCKPLGTLLSRSGGRLAAPVVEASRLAFTGRLLGWFVASLAGAIAIRLREYRDEGPGRARVRELRAEFNGRPRVWLGIVGDWPRTSRCVVQGVGFPAAAAGERVGILLQNSLHPGLRRENNVRARAGTEVFPTLDSPELVGNIAAVDQCAAAESLPTLLRLLLESAFESLRVLGRLAMRGPSFQLGPMPVSLDRDVRSLARLVVLDVLRAREAAHATRAFLARQGVDGRTFVFPHASLANVAVPDLLLQGAGATTVDLVHGALAESVDMITNAATNSTVKVLWTEAEAEYLRPYTSNARLEGGYVPRPLPPVRARAAAPRGPLRVLALTNYANLAGAADLPPLFPYQQAFFEALQPALAQYPPPIEVRWRPHPSDDRPTVRRVASEFASLAMSLSLEPDALASDLAWADLVLTSVSTSIVEALTQPIPIFVHDVPLYDAAEVLAFFRAERRFKNGEDLAHKLLPALEKLAQDAPDKLAPENYLRMRFFGKTGRPKPLAELLGIGLPPPAMSAS